MVIDALVENEIVVLDKFALTQREIKQVIKYEV
jgi:hypothetical protein